MRAALWALGLGILLFTVRAVPTGKFLLPSSMEAPGGRGFLDAEALGLEYPCCDQLSAGVLLSQKQGHILGQEGTWAPNADPWRCLFPP